MGKQKKQRLTRTQKIMLEVVEANKHHEHDLTRQQYIRNTKRYIQFCREKHDVKTLEDCRMHVQEYVDFLIEKNYAASTVYTYAASLASTFDMKLSQINTPKRHIAEFTRGRKRNQNATKRANLEHPDWEPLVTFQREVGLRRNELKNLNHKNLKLIDNRFYIEIEQGKGGKYFLSALLPHQEKIILPYFDKTKGDEKIFSTKLFQNDLNLHYLRAKAASDFYYYHLAKLEKDPTYAKVLEEEIIQMWNKYNINPKTGKPKPFNHKQIEGYYFLRGNLKKLAHSKNLPTRYSKLVATYTSIMKTSHYRCSVTIQNYLLAV